MHLPDDVHVVVNARAHEHLRDTYAAALQYMDTHRDRQVLKMIMASLTSVRFAGTLQTRNNKRKVTAALHKYSGIKQTSQIVRNDLTNVQQYQLQRRIISARKLKEIKTISTGRGRKLRSNNFPIIMIMLFTYRV